MIDMEWVTVGLVFLFFWILLSQYVYREAKKENRSSPKLRGVCWWALGVIGAVTYLIRLRDRETNRLTWLAVSLLLFTVWVVGTAGLWGLNGGFHLWAALFAGLFILYWQFNLETVGSEKGAGLE
jgi:hypothetical protein